MLTIAYDIQIGSLAFRPANESRLVALRLDASFDIPVNACTLEVTLPDDLSIAPGDAVTVQLGYGDDLQTVFTGAVQSCSWAVGRARVEAVSLFRQLAALRLHAYFENPTAGDIVQAMAGETDVATGTIEPGLSYAFYAVGTERTVWEHINDLAGQCGFDFYADADDQLVFGRGLPGAPAVFQYGVNVLDLKIDDRPVAAGGVEVYGESPSSTGGGPDAAPWFSKSDVLGSAGGSPARRVYQPAARSQDTASRIADALWTRDQIGKTGLLRTLGDPDLKLGSQIQIMQMPNDNQNGTYKITSLRHTLKPATGFITQVGLSAT